MLKNRLIPVLLLKNGFLVRSEIFKIHQIIGNPLEEVKRYNEWCVDELIYLDITRDNYYHDHRKDIKSHPANQPMQILEEVSKCCFIPLSWGGNIRTIKDIITRLSIGADKVILNTGAFESNNLIKDAVNIVGGQSIVIGIDVLKENKNYRVLINGGHTITNAHPVEWAKTVEDMGAGEIFLQSINRDGTGLGYDLEIINEVSNRVNIPIIACGGVGNYEHYVEGIMAGASAVAAANFWHFKELPDKNAKRILHNSGVSVRI